MQLLRLPLVVGLIFIVSLLGSSIFVVYESNRAIVARLGQLQNNEAGGFRILGPGLHFKLPFLDTILMFDSRLNMSETPSARIVTKEKKDLIVDLFVQWRIKDFALFYTTTSTAGERDNKERAEELLQQKVVDVVRAEFGQRTIRQVVSGERKELMEKLRVDTDENVNGYGMEVVDVRIKRIDLPPDVSGAVFDRMRSERSRVASELRAKGESKAEMIRAEAEKQVRVMLAESSKEAEMLRGQGDAQAFQIYANSYNKSPQFYEFYRSLEAYKNGFNQKQDVLVLRSDSAFFKYFLNMNKMRGSNNE